MNKKEIIALIKDSIDIQKKCIEENAYKDEKDRDIRSCVLCELQTIYNNIIKDEEPKDNDLLTKDYIRPNYEIEFDRHIKVINELKEENTKLKEIHFKLLEKLLLKEK